MQIRFNAVFGPVVVGDGDNLLGVGELVTQSLSDCLLLGLRGRAIEWLHAMGVTAINLHEWELLPGMEI